MPNKLKEVQEQFIQRLLVALENGRIPWRATWDQGIMAPVNAKTNMRYTGVNALNLYLTAIELDYDDPRWMTFKQAKDQGYSIIKGSKGTSIYHYKFKDTKHNEYMDLSDVVKLSDSERQNIRIIPMVYSVFNAKQIDGIPELKRAEAEVVFNNSKAALFSEKLIENMGVQLMHGGNQAYYSPDRDQIVIPSKEAFIDEQEYYATRLHETAHATGHRGRMDRDLSGTFGSEKYALEELRAELASVFLTLDIGFCFGEFHEKNHQAYIRSWSKGIKENPKALFQSIGEAQKIRDYMLEKGEYERIYEQDERPLETEIGQMEKGESRGRAAPANDTHEAVKNKGIKGNMQAANERSARKDHRTVKSRIQTHER